MATVDSTLIAALEAGTRQPSHRYGGMVRESRSVATTLAAQASADIVRMVRVPSNARISSILFSAADATTAGAINIGLYDTMEDGVGAVVDADLFASALDLTAGPYANAEQAFESGEYTIAESETALWEVLGLSADSNKDYDVALTVSTTFDGGPTSVALAAKFVM